MSKFRDFTGEQLNVGDRIKLQGATDSTLPTYLLLENGRVTGFARTRVILELDQYPGREVRALPRAMQRQEG
jgi:hypothetical protein